ncbi:MAG: VWA domain-containing protein, partial [Pirellula sp.]
MSFLHASLLLGGIIAVIPVILHLLGRKQPKAIVFPAIRFVRQTAVHAQRGWSIKRWLLMALRVLVILLLALALAAPRVQSGMYATYLMILLVVILAALATAAALTAYGTRLSWRATVTAGAIAAVLWIVGGSWLSAALLQKQSAPMPTASGPISAAVVIDTSPSMGYKYHNVTRLEAAKEMAMWLMDRLPVGSQIAIVNSDAGVRLNQDRVSANRLLDRTMVEGRAANLVHRISASIDALRKSELERREVYVLTDVSMTAWRDAEVSDIPAKLSRLENGLGKPNQENVLVQVIDVSVPANEIRNWSLNNFKLSQQSATPGSQVSISLDLQSAPGSGGEQIKVELAVEDATVNPLVRDNKSIVSKAVAVEQQMIEVGDGASIPFKFNLKNIVEGTNHFEVRIARPDPLEVDNIVYCTVEARTQNQTLVVADDEEEGRLVCKAIDPAFEAESQQVNKQEQREPLFRLATSSQLPSIDLSRFTSMVLYEPTNISADMSDRIKRWVAQGGGI